jgi:hypothetical protein
MTQIDFTEGRFTDTIRASLNEITELGDIPVVVSEYLKRDEVEPSAVTDDTDALQRRMWRYLQSRGVKVKPGQGQKYDEIMFVAYDQALRSSRGGDDPLASIRTGDSVGTGWDFTVKTFDQMDSKGVSAESIKAAGAIDYIAEMGERLGVFRITEALVLDWASGVIDVADGAAAGKLYKYWKELDQRSDANERGLLYRRVLGKGTVELLPRMAANDAFPQLWSNLMSEVARYIDKSEQLEQGRSEGTPVSPQPIYQCIREIQYNLTEFCTGMAFIQTREMYAQLNRAFDIIGDPDIVAHFGGTRRRSMWKVIETVSRDALRRNVNASPIVQLATSGNKIFQLCATFDSATFSPAQLNELVDAAESYIINSSLVNETDAESPEKPDDQKDEFGTDQFDDF